MKERGERKHGEGQSQPDYEVASHDSKTARSWHHARPILQMAEAGRGTAPKLSLRQSTALGRRGRRRRCRATADKDWKRAARTVERTKRDVPRDAVDAVPSQELPRRYIGPVDTPIYHGCSNSPSAMIAAAAMLGLRRHRARACRTIGTAAPAVSGCSRTRRLKNGKHHRPRRAK